MTPTLDILTTLAPLDWGVFALVLLVTLLTVLYGNLRRRRLPSAGAEADLLDLLLMGRRLTLPLFTATLVATWYGGIFSVTEYTMDVGLYNWMTQGVFWYASYLIFAFYLVKKIRDTEARTMPELLAGMFGPRSGKLGAWLNLLNVLPVTYVIMLGLFLRAIFGGDLMMWMVVGTAAVVAYSTFGGFRSVVYSDLIQFGVMCTSVVLVIVFSMRTFGGISWLRAQPSIPAGHWKPLGDGIPLSATLVWGFLAMSALVDPNFYQRCLAAKDVKTARRGILLATAVWIGFDFCTTFGALYALANLPDASRDTAYLFYSVQLLPAGLRGLFLAGILATILSTLDSYLFLSGTIAAYDLAPKRLKGNILFHHAGTVIMALLALGAAAVFQHTEANLVELWKFFGGYATGCLLLPLLTGYVFPGKVTDLNFVCSCLAGVGAMTLFYIARLVWSDLAALQNLEPFYVGLLGTCIVFAGVLARQRDERGEWRG